MRRYVDLIRTVLYQLDRWSLHALLVALMVVGLTGDGPPPASIETQALRAIANRRFNFVGWEIDALWGKLTHSLIAPQRYMTKDARRAFVLEYLRITNEIGRLESSIRILYTDPAVEDPNEATRNQQVELGDLRAKQSARQLVAEAILQEQVASILMSEGFGGARQLLPPVNAHFTPLPSLVVVSPRDQIETLFSHPLEHGLNTAQREAIEAQIDGDLDVSSLVTGIGGLAAYPAMLLESGSINWITNVIAHEWAHHYLAPRPLGWNYMGSPETRTINETVASIVGQEIGRQVIARYYPEYLPPEPPEKRADEDRPPPKAPPEPPTFGFRAEMHETRVHVDELLAAGKVEAAERYMEERREVFVEQGYAIRKLNQAYFAFHGAYADQPGASGADPIGPAVRQLRERSPDLHTFVGRIAGVTTLWELKQALDAHP